MGQGAREGWSEWWLERSYSSISPTTKKPTNVTFLPLVAFLLASLRSQLRFGWDGTTALGGAVDNSKPARLLSDIKASGETLPPDAELFLQNMEMDKEGFTFQEFLDMINSVYETGLIEFRNGGVLNKEVRGCHSSEGSEHSDLPSVCLLRPDKH